MEILGKLLIWLFSLAWHKGWPGWLAAAAVAVAGGISLVVALVALIAASVTDDWNSPFLYSALILAVAGMLPLAWKMWRGVRRRDVAGLDASRASRDHDDGNSITRS
ncbi:MAG: hypothetical protein OXF56_15140 [Rhodobacteraceae bacterium]|nr:hypothetical protein [Paracoccaceae bacterium]